VNNVADVAEKSWRRFEATVEAWNGDDNNPGKTWEIVEGEVKARVRIKPDGEIVFSFGPGNWVMTGAYLRSKGTDMCNIAVRREP